MNNSDIQLLCYRVAEELRNKEIENSQKFAELNPAVCGAVVLRVLTSDLRERK